MAFGRRGRARCGPPWARPRRCCSSRSPSSGATVPADHLGDASAISTPGGRLTGTNSAGSSSQVEALLPLASTQDTSRKPASMTRGRGTFLLAFDHYDVCPPHTAKRVIKESGFQRSDDED